MNDTFPRCDVPDCYNKAPVKYTDGLGRRCWPCLEADKNLGEAPLLRQEDGQ